MTQRDIIKRNGGATVVARRLGVTVRHAFRLQNGQTRIKPRLLARLAI
jgi:hypothetical protein